MLSLNPFLVTGGIPAFSLMSVQKYCRRTDVISEYGEKVENCACL
jgi:hypothetical protein